MSLETGIPAQSFEEMDVRMFKTYLMAMKDRAKEMNNATGSRGVRR
jgi:hypothetical protein